MRDYQEDVERALAIRSELLHEIKHGKLSRRALYKKALFGGGALAVLASLRGGNKAHANDRDDLNVAPRTDPFKNELIHVNRPEHVIQPRQTLSPMPQKRAQQSAGGGAYGECGRPDHQAWEKYWPTYPDGSYDGDRCRMYMMVQRAFKAKIDPRLEEEDVWGFDGRSDAIITDPREAARTTLSPGPTFWSYYGQPVMVRIRNDLPLMGAFTGHGCSETSTHLHNGHTPCESDGNPDEYFPRNNERDPSKRNPGNWRDHHYPMMCAGDDYREALGTLWYHDHRHDFTAPNVYRGLAGFHLCFDDLDANDDTKGLKLPCRDYDVPLMISDKFVKSNGRIFFDQFNFDGIIGNKYVVNGLVQPRMKVERRHYRLRLLNPGVSRVYAFSLMTSESDKGLKNAKFIPDGAAWIIGTGGNLLPERIPFKNGVPVGPSQRLDLWVDFSKIPASTKFLYLVNRFEQYNGRMPENYQGSGPDGVRFQMLNPGDPIMQFELDGTVLSGVPECPRYLRPVPWNDPGDPAMTAAHAKLGALGEDQILNAIGKSNPFPGIINPRTNQPMVDRVREWKFDRVNGQWSVNGKLYSSERVDAKVRLNSGEIWIIQGAGSWVHPIHLHSEEHRTLFRDGKRPKPGNLEYGRDDTMVIGPGERGILFRQFRDWTGKYVMHCHNVVHEDHAMMVRFDVE